jgi:predicted nucleic acid-binding protein
MMVYLDASVVIRKVQREAGSLREWGRWERAYSSELLRVEVLRTIDRTRLRGALLDSEVAAAVEKAQAIFDGLLLLELTQSILDRASQSFLTPLGTLDALHLATALRLVEASRVELTFLTHDTELATAARSMNFRVEGA